MPKVFQTCILRITRITVHSISFGWSSRQIDTSKHMLITVLYILHLACLLHSTRTDKLLKFGAHIYWKVFTVVGPALFFREWSLNKPLATVLSALQIFYCNITILLPNSSKHTLPRYCNVQNSVSVVQSHALTGHSLQLIFSAFFRSFNASSLTCFSTKDKKNSWPAIAHDGLSWILCWQQMSLTTVGDDLQHANPAICTFFFLPLFYWSQLFSWHHSVKVHVLLHICILGSHFFCIKLQS
jgi:hypothetical protein